MKPEELVGKPYNEVKDNPKVVTTLVDGEKRATLPVRDFSIVYIEVQDGIITKASRK